MFVAASKRSVRETLRLILPMGLSDRNRLARLTGNTCTYRRLAPDSNRGFARVGPAVHNNGVSAA